MRPKKKNNTTVSLKRAKNDLLKFQRRSDDLKKARQNLTQRDILEIRKKFIPTNPFVRIPYHYWYLHSVFRHVMGGRLRGKKILDLGASIGVYTRFLQSKGAHAIGIDIVPDYLKEAKARGAKNLVNASALAQSTVELFERNGNVIGGIKIDQGLPFKNSSFDAIISDHFLFANYHQYVYGFENHPGSIKKSEEALNEYNRILKKGGRIIIGDAHPNELPDLQKYIKGFKTHGFVVEYTWNPPIKKPMHLDGPVFFVLKKVAELNSK